MLNKLKAKKKYIFNLLTIIFCEQENIIMHTSLNNRLVG